ncbi:hypothetical protein D5S17_14485 [Pseudonocardiaceae bacterium YIM PH 21723]|nr:hypothetical protein D5S17_14485 [Pseudonocardiaceae bacterium YIM PH 21723]
MRQVEIDCLTCDGTGTCGDGCCSCFDGCDSGRITVTVVTEAELAALIGDEDQDDGGRAGAS